MYIPAVAHAAELVSAVLSARATVPPILCDTKCWKSGLRPCKPFEAIARIYGLQL